MLYEMTGVADEKFSFLSIDFSLMFAFVILKSTVRHTFFNQVRYDSSV
jgi:hypothetical protein